MSLRRHIRILREAANYDIGNHPCPCGCGVQLKPNQTIHRDTYVRATKPMVGDVIERRFGPEVKAIVRGFRSRTIVQKALGLGEAQTVTLTRPEDVTVFDGPRDLRELNGH
jgi:hypothetical protein